MYPSYHWRPWLFKHVSPQLLHSECVSSEFLTWLEQKLCITSAQQWLEVSVQHLKHFHARSFIENGSFRTLIPFLIKRYPNVIWEERRFWSVSCKSQRLLYRIICFLFPYCKDILWNANLALEMSIMKMVNIDIVIPSLSLALEYNGPHHYHHLNFYGSPLAQQRRDSRKEHICTARGITLISIGYWWDFEISFVQETIFKHRPDLLHCNRDSESLSY